MAVCHTPRSGSAVPLPRFSLSLSLSAVAAARSQWWRPDSTWLPPLTVPHQPAFEASPVPSPSHPDPSSRHLEAVPLARSTQLGESLGTRRNRPDRSHHPLKVARLTTEMQHCIALYRKSDVSADAVLCQVRRPVSDLVCTFERTSVDAGRVVAVSVVCLKKNEKRQKPPNPLYYCSAAVH